MAQLKCELTFDISSNNELDHYTIEADESGKEYRLVLTGGRHIGAQGRETQSFKGVPFEAEAQKFTTRGDAITYIKNQVQRLLDAAFELPPIKVQRF